MKIEAILTRLEGVRRNGNGWIALCPAHEDRNPSLSIHERDGKILLYCHAGCSTEAVCAAARIETHHLFSDAAQPQAVKPRVTAEYPYFDEKWNLLYVVERHEPKGFKQRRLVGTDGWRWDLNGVRRVLYMLPLVLDSSEVLVVEGEKDADTAGAMGLCGTTNAGGANAPWLEEYSASLHGKHVTIIADADEPGRKHAQQVAQSLYGKAASLKVLELPGAKDLTEWVEHGGSHDLLKELIHSAPEWKPPLRAASGFTLTPLAELLAEPDVPAEYIVENLLVAGTVSCVAAKPKVGKSTFARNLCLAVSRGEGFLDLKTKQGECIYLVLEERKEDVRNDFRAMGADGSEPIYIHAAAAPAEGMAALCDMVRQRRPVLVVVDPLFRMANIRDEKAYAETYAALGPLIDVAREVGTHILVTHHAGKSAKADAIDSPLGSTAIGGAVCTLVLLKRTQSAMRTVQTVQRVGTDITETVLRFDVDTHRITLGEARLEAEREDCEPRILKFLEDASEPQTQEHIRDGVEGQTRIVRAALTALVKARRVKRSGEGKKGRPFVYEFPNTGSQDIPGTRKPESQEEPNTRINTSGIPVSDSPSDSIPVSVQRKRGASLVAPDFAEYSPSNGV